MDLQTAEFREAQAKIWSQAFSFANCAALKCAVKLGIADAIDNHDKKALTLSELTEELSIKPSKSPFLQRLMRQLVNAGFFTEAKQLRDDNKDGRTTTAYALTPVSRLLLKNEQWNLRGIVLTMLDPAELKAWSVLNDWFKNDDPTAFQTAHEKNYWDYTAENTQHCQIFEDAMANDSVLVSKLLVTEYKFLFEGLTSLIDLGGSTGTIAKALAKSFPNLKCTVFDLPHVVANLESTKNLEFVGGDMFEKLPPSNAILLKWILHDWNDEDCVKILKNCKKAIQEKGNGGKVIIIDTVVYSQKNEKELVDLQISMDMAMVINFAAKERTEEEWEHLIREAGFSGHKIFPMYDFRSIIEVYP
uniref:Flavonoid 4'-O-methyltransferase n=1 Tax=Catharanthus roseus TaxID=4058 RepID=Q6VCW3_CATRO|nr:flavonoid 4'-O-methyltransferase [Catharanthus roseus]AAR02420.1 flavonoid 4'-O-methyltransferase [Catharanthus roseus]UTD45116.1 CrOMT [Catharanthus roseus]